MSATIEEQPFTLAKIPVSSWSFAIRVWLAMILALFVSFWLQLEAPATAALTVGILAEPTRGQALDTLGICPDNLFRQLRSPPRRLFM